MDWQTFFTALAIVAAAVYLVRVVIHASGAGGDAAAPAACPGCSGCGQPCASPVSDPPDRVPDELGLPDRAVLTEGVRRPAAPSAPRE